jgi:hypothetical protein
MVYTCFEMVRDCRANLPEGWRYLASAYVPVIRRILAHYAPGAGDEAARVERVLLALRQPGCALFQSTDPSPERWLVGELRQMILAELPVPEPEIALDLETVTEALAPLTATEKQAAWFETMHHDSASTGALMRVAPATVEKIRGRAAELIRGKVDRWNRSMLADNGLALGHEAAAAGGKDCLPVKAFLDILDGRTTWREREVMERHVNVCWHCVDHVARMQEVIGLLRSSRPLSDQDAAPYRKLLGVAEERRPAWKRLLGAR